MFWDPKSPAPGRAGPAPPSSTQTQAAFAQKGVFPAQNKHAGRLNQQSGIYFIGVLWFFFFSLSPVSIHKLPHAHFHREAPGVHERWVRNEG